MTYAAIQAEVKRAAGFCPKTCWIAHVKEQLGFEVRRAPNRHGTERVFPCPANKRQAIAKAIARLS
jgi:hypothetical protein